MCHECGVVSRFLPGHHPRRNGWISGRCPACVAASIAARLQAMTEEEKRQAARDAILGPKGSDHQDPERVHLPRPMVKVEKRKLVREGLCEWASPAKPPSKPKTRRKGQGAASYPDAPGGRLPDPCVQPRSLAPNGIGPNK